MSGKKIAVESDIAKVEVWNIADGYVKFKILFPLIEADKLEKIAQYGYEKIEEAFMASPMQVTSMRIEALHRLKDILILIRGNVFHLVNKKARDKLDSVTERITTVEKAFKILTSLKENNVTNKKEVMINEEHFSTCFDILKAIKTDIISPLNASNLIFPKSDETDLQAQIDRLIHGG